MSSLFLGIAFTLGFFPSAPAFTVQSSHPRLLLTPSDVAFIRNNSVQDGNMESLSLSSWSDIGTPTLKEKVDFLGSKRLHLKGSYSVGIQQSLPFIPHVEYQYSISIYGVSGQFGAQLYQQGNPSGELIKTTSTGGWQTFTGTFTPSSGPLLFKIYGLNGANEFYVDNVTFRPSGERVVDANMTYSDCTYWSSMAIPPLVREKTLLGSDKVLHVVGSNGSGVQQFLNFKKNNEYTYSLSLFLKSGKCRAQFYQGSKVVPILDLTAPTAGWQTINIPSTKSFFPEDDFLLVRIYANDPSGNSEFYVKNVSCKPTLERVLDGDMSDADCSYWSSTGTPQVKEKTVLNGTRQLHFIGNSTSGAYQELQFKPGVEYAFSMEIALV
ncbi:MAG: carbohydrate binding domain-containing protein, partial [Verrucomicrobiota bacterium]